MDYDSFEYFKGLHRRMIEPYKNMCFDSKYVADNVAERIIKFNTVGGDELWAKVFVSETLWNGKKYMLNIYSYEGQLYVSRRTRPCSVLATDGRLLFLEIEDLKDIQRFLYAQAILRDEWDDGLKKFELDISERDIECTSEAITKRMEAREAQRQMGNKPPWVIRAMKP